MLMICCILIINMIIIAVLHVVHLNVIEEQHYTYNTKLKTLLKTIDSDVQSSNEVKAKLTNKLEISNQNIDEHAQVERSHIKGSEKTKLLDQVEENAKGIKTQKGMVNTNASALNNARVGIDANDRNISSFDSQIRDLKSKNIKMTGVMRQDILSNSEHRTVINQELETVKDEFETLMNDYETPAIRRDMGYILDDMNTLQGQVNAHYTNNSHFSKSSIPTNADEIVHTTEETAIIQGDIVTLNDEIRDLNVAIASAETSKVNNQRTLEAKRIEFSNLNGQKTRYQTLYDTADESKTILEIKQTDLILEPGHASEYSRDDFSYINEQIKVCNSDLLLLQNQIVNVPEAIDRVSENNGYVEIATNTGSGGFSIKNETLHVNELDNVDFIDPYTVQTNTRNVTYFSFKSIKLDDTTKSYQLRLQPNGIVPPYRVGSGFSFFHLSIYDTLTDAYVGNMIGGDVLGSGYYPNPYSSSEEFTNSTNFLVNNSQAFYADINPQITNKTVSSSPRGGFQLNTPLNGLYFTNIYHNFKITPVYSDTVPNRSTGVPVGNTSSNIKAPITGIYDLKFESFYDEAMTILAFTTYYSWTNCKTIDLTNSSRYKIGVFVRSKSISIKLKEVTI